MKRRIFDLKKLGLLAGLAVIAASAYAIAPASDKASAAPTGMTVSTTTPAVNTAFTITASWTDEGTSAILSATKSIAAGSFSSCTVTTNADGQSAVIAAGTPTDTCTVGDDLDTVVETTGLSATYTCTTAGTVTFTFSQNGAPSPGGSVAVTCGGGTTNNGSISVTFSNTSFSCGASTVSAFVQSSPGVIAADGTTVSFSSNEGYFSPATANTVSGYATVLFTPTNQFSIATVSATALGLVGSNTLSGNCFNNFNGIYNNNPYLNQPAYVPPVVSQPLIQQPVTQPAVVSAPQQPVASAPVQSAPAIPPSFFSSILPPNTGDAGLAATN